MRLFIVAPTNDILTERTTAVWARELETLARTLGLDPWVSIGPGVTRAAVGDELDRHYGEPGLFCFLDHGTEDALADANKGPLIDDANAGLLAGKFAYVIACEAARGLGAKAIGAGAAGFLGFNDKIYLMLVKNYPQIAGRCLVSGLVALLRDGASADQARVTIAHNFAVAMQALARRKAAAARLETFITFRHNRKAVTLLGDHEWRWHAASPGPQTCPAHPFGQGSDCRRTVA